MAGKRKGWTQLSETYRRRLQRAGITARQYGAGASLRNARGHKTAPESTVNRRRLRAGRVSILTYVPDFYTLPPATQEEYGRLFYQGFLQRGLGAPGEGLSPEGRKWRYRSDAQHDAQVRFLEWYETHYKEWNAAEDWQRYRFEYQLAFSAAA